MDGEAYLSRNTGWRVPHPILARTRDGLPRDWDSWLNVHHGQSWAVWEGVRRGASRSPHGEIPKHVGRTSERESNIPSSLLGPRLAGSTAFCVPYKTVIFLGFSFSFFSNPFAAICFARERLKKIMVIS